MGKHTDAVRAAEAGLGDAAMQQRREREREAALARELDGHRRTTNTTETETQRRVGGALLTLCCADANLVCPCPECLS